MAHVHTGLENMVLGLKVRADSSGDMLKSAAMPSCNVERDPDASGKDENPGAAQLMVLE